MNEFRLNKKIYIKLQIKIKMISISKNLIPLNDEFEINDAFYQQNIGSWFINFKKYLNVFNYIYQFFKYLSVAATVVYYFVFLL